MTYTGTYASQVLTHPSTAAGRGTYPHTPRTPGGAYDDYSRYPYSEPAYNDGAADYAGYGDLRRTPSAYSSYATPRMTSNYTSGTYDDLSVGRHTSTYGANDYDYIGPGAMTPSRSRRSSSTSYHPRQTANTGMGVGIGGGLGSTLYGNPSAYQRQPQYPGSGSYIPRIKFCSQYASSGMSLSEAVNGVRLAAADTYKWHEMHADRNGEILLKVAWVGYRNITYRVPVDYYENRIRLSSLARRVARACIHYLQSNGISASWDQVKIHAIEEITYGVWQPQLTVKW